MKTENHLSDWEPPDIGALFVVTGPSGSGKTTLVKAALERFEKLSFSVSATTRPMRKGEKNGVDYHFMNEETFRDAVNDGDFLEWAKVYSNYYGTLSAPVEKALSRGESIILDIDPQGAEQVRAKNINEVSIFILPPNIETLHKRLGSRNTDSTDVILKRMRESKEQLQNCIHFDYLVVNDDLDSAINQFQSIIIAELLRTSRRKTWSKKFSL